MKKKYAVQTLVQFLTYSICVCDINYTLFLIVTGVTLRQVTQYIRSEATPYGSVGTCTVFFLIDIAIFQKHNSGTGRKRLFDNFWLLTLKKVNV